MLGLGTYVLNGLVLILAYFIKASVNDLRGDIKALKDKQELTDKEINKLEVSMPTNYVQRGDFNTLFNRIDELQRTTHESLMDIHSLLITMNNNQR